MKPQRVMHFRNPSSGKITKIELPNYIHSTACIETDYQRGWNACVDAIVEALTQKDE